MIQITLNLFTKLSTKQEELDSNIRKQHDISTDVWLEDLHTNHLLATKNEIAEVHNEMFDKWKYWKTKEVDEKLILEEAVDVIHFLHLLINKYQSKPENCVTFINNQVESINASLDKVNPNYTKAMDRMLNLRTLEDYLCCYATLLILLETYNFNLEDIEAAYDIKNEINHLRQEEGY
ncbi:dUTP diphosphatase [Macrococcus equi]|uniref:dUTP diphosphatase n=1 Tax=Macrococcus equi TaxID=3395462 RepID=UPI0039BE97C0